MADSKQPNKRSRRDSYLKWMKLQTIIKHKRATTSRRIPLSKVDLHTLHFAYGAWSSLKKQPYFGYCVRPSRRERQHNGEIKGGAKTTREMDDSSIQIKFAACPLMNKGDATQFEEGMRKKSLIGGLKWAIESMGAKSLLWRPGLSEVTSDDKKRDLLGPYHLFLMADLPFTMRQIGELNALAKKHKDRVNVHWNSTHETIEEHRKAHIARLKPLLAAQKANSSQKIAVPAPVVPFAGVEFVRVSGVLVKRAK